MAKYHFMTLCIVTFGILASAASHSLQIQRTEVPNREAVRLYLQQSQLPASLKDPLELEVLRGNYINVNYDIKLPGSAARADWHVDRVTYRALAYTDFGGKGISLYPAFLQLTEKEQVRLVVHLALHQLTGLGVTRLSEQGITAISDLMEKDAEAKTPEARAKIRKEFKTLLERSWVTDAKGKLLRTTPQTTYLDPWPFTKDSKRGL